MKNSLSPNPSPSRRTFLKHTGTAALGFCLGRSFNIQKVCAAEKGRIIMLGYDGMEPSVVDEMLDRGDLPNLATLRKSGGYHRLTSTIPPQSPVAWNSFATCKNPGGHNIFDFIRRIPNGAQGPSPLVGTGKLVPANLYPDGTISENAHAENFRTGMPFWSVSDDQGKRGKIINIPFAFPPDPLKNGIMISALGVPDLRGTTSTYFSLSDSFTKEQLSESLGGGKRISLSFTGTDETQINIPGPRDSRYPFSNPNAYAQTPITLYVDRKNARGVVKSSGKQVDLIAGAWSDWMELTFKLTDTFTVMGIARFFPAMIGAQVRIYMSCVQYHPDAPYTPFTTPASYSSELKGRLGMFKTIGWAYDTHALRQNDLEEDAFLMDVDYTMSWREKLTLDEFQRDDYDMLLSAWTATDRVGHMFWRFRDEKHPFHQADVPDTWKYALEYTYKRADAFVGKIMAQLRENDTLFVLSDHGFGTWRTGFNLNTWLRDQGYLTVSDPSTAQAGFLMGIDWSKTKAYSVGLSSLYLNLKDRETFGIVSREQAQSLTEELISRLSEVTDPSTGAKVFSNLYRSGLFHGISMKNAPDISLGYAPSYQNGRQTSRGGVGEALFEPIMDKWSGEHAATDYQICPGVLFSNKPLAKDQPHIQDLGVTALTAMGLDVPSDYEGEPIL